MSVSIVVPTYNGRELLDRHLPGVLLAARAVGADVVVVDDASTDDSAALMRARFPDVRLVVRPVNGGFSLAMNDGMAAARGDVAVCLNNDVAVPLDFLPPLLTHFADRQCFAVSPSMRREGGDESYVRGRFRRGFLEIHRPPARTASGARPILYACGGAVAYAREKFLALGGFDPLFSPFNGEDLDLSYRGWKRGWRVLWEPASVVTHVGRATIGRFYPTPFIRHTQVRARIIFAWKNILDPVWTAEHWALLPFRTALRAARGERWFVTALRSCLRDLPAIRAARSRERREARVSDRDVFRIVAPP